MYCVFRTICTSKSAWWCHFYCGGEEEERVTAKNSKQADSPVCHTFPQVRSSTICDFTTHRYPRKMWASQALVTLVNSEMWASQAFVALVNNEMSAPQAFVTLVNNEMWASQAFVKLVNNEMWAPQLTYQVLVTQERFSVLSDVTNFALRWYSYLTVKESCIAFWSNSWAWLWITHGP